jgi:probable phosphoglycerate mutase
VTGRTVERTRRGATRAADAPALLAYIDGGARGNPGPAGYGVFITRQGAGPDDPPVAELYGFLGVATNNTAEYAALLALLEHTGPLRPASLTVRSDSELLIRQMKGEYRVKDPKLRILHGEARRLVTAFVRVTLEHVPRENNKDADALANKAMDLKDSSGPLPAALHLVLGTGQQMKLPSL